jgi:DNA-binding PadR family transcriptional regulator
MGYAAGVNEKESSSMSLKHALLTALSGKPQSGYDLSREIEGSIGFFWNASHQQIYQELAKLETQGWLGVREVAQAGKPDKKVYRVTAAGLRELKRWMTDDDPDLPPIKDGLMIKLFAGHLVDPDVIRSAIETQAARRQVRLNRFREIESRFFAGQTLSLERQYQYLGLRRGIRGEEAWLEWSKEALAIIQKK